MLGKAVLTLFVIIVAILVVKQRNDQDSGKQKPAQGKAGQTDNNSGPDMGSDLRFAAYMFLVLMFGTGAFIYYQRWQDDHTVLSVNLYRDGQSQPASYEVYKFQLESRSFTTTEGIRITVADNERMEVTGLE